jgi:hypothetical protein
MGNRERKQWWNIRACSPEEREGDEPKNWSEVTQYRKYNQRPFKHAFKGNYLITFKIILEFFMWKHQYTSCTEKKSFLINEIENH